jgi:hypothetical protein
MWVSWSVAALEGSLLVIETQPGAVDCRKVGPQYQPKLEINPQGPGPCHLMPEVQEKRQQAEKLSAPRWWMVYMATLLYLAFIILLLDWLTRHFRPS